MKGMKDTMLWFWSSQVGTAAVPSLSEREGDEFCACFPLNEKPLACRVALAHTQSDTETSSSTPFSPTFSSSDFDSE